jgi:hypothetical protein
MKKFLTLMLALALALTAVSALASSPTVPSKTDSTPAEETEEFSLWIDATKADLANAEIDKLNDAGIEYFGAAGDAIAAILGEGEYEVNEFAAVSASNSDAIEGDTVTVTLAFATPYEAGAKVAVLIGIVGDEEIAWNVYEGTGVEGGAVSFELPATVAADIENGSALIAVVNAK